MLTRVSGYLVRGVHELERLSETFVKDDLLTGWRLDDPYNAAAGHLIRLESIEDNIVGTPSPRTRFVLKLPSTIPVLGRRMVFLNVMNEVRIWTRCGLAIQAQS